MKLTESQKTQRTWPVQPHVREGDDGSFSRWIIWGVGEGKEPLTWVSLEAFQSAVSAEW